MSYLGLSGPQLNPFRAFKELEFTPAIQYDPRKMGPLCEANGVKLFKQAITRLALVGSCLLLETRPDSYTPFDRRDAVPWVALTVQLQDVFLFPSMRNHGPSPNLNSHGCLKHKRGTRSADEARFLLRCEISWRPRQAPALHFRSIDSLKTV